MALALIAAVCAALPSASKIPTCSSVVAFPGSKREVCYRARVSDDLILRPARRDELSAVAHLAGKLVRMHHAFDERRFSLPDRVEEGYAWWFGQEIDRDEVALLVALRGGAIVGYAYGRLEERDWNQLLDACGALHDVWV
jgi:hypothetical protein